MKRLLILLIIFLPACSWFESKPKPTQLQVREFQTRTFDIKDQKAVMKALLNVLQDEGFIVKSADANLGFLSATKETDLGYGGTIFWPSQGKGEPQRYKKTQVIETTANVSKTSDGYRVRVNFQKKTLDNMGSVVDVEHVTEQSFYQDFFMKVDKGIFLHKEKL